jgi:YbbR domain-containing protein
MKRFLRQYVLNNWNLKATAILLALILWLFVRGEPGPERVVAVPLEVRRPRLMEIVNERPSTIDVTMRGAAYSNILFSPSLPTCVIDLTDASEGKHTVNITPENVSISKGSGIEVLQVNPSLVDIVLERTVSKAVPIVVPIQGEPAQGFEVYRKSSKPANVTVNGPRSQIEPLETVTTQTISIAGQKQSASFFVRLDLSNKIIRTDYANPIQVDVQIGPRRKLQTFRNIPITLEDPAYTTDPKKISVQILASPEVLEHLKIEDFSVMIAMDGLDLSQLPVKVKPEVRLPGSLDDIVEIRTTQPSEVLLRLHKVK